MKEKEYGMMDWSEKHKAPMVESYQPSEREFGGETNKTLDYVARRNKIQSHEVSQLKKDEYHGRYS